MLVSITSPNTLIPFPDFCSQSNITNCGLDRGVSHGDGFVSVNSTTWNASSAHQWQGFDTVDLSYFGGPSLDQQPILGITTAIPFLASLGLYLWNQVGILSKLQGSGDIPSLSFGYTADAAYRK
jgi:hypothetical protein